MNRLVSKGLSLALIMALGLGVNACSGGGDSTTPVTTPSATEQEEEQEVTTNTLETVIQKDYESQTLLVTSENPNVEAYFVDSPVENLVVIEKDSQGEVTQSSITSENGRFACSLKSETVYFYAENILLGTSSCDAKVFTPYDLNNMNPTKGNNILRALQAFDSDGDPSNGITLREVSPIKTEAQGLAYLANVDTDVDFNTDLSVFNAIENKVSTAKAERFEEITPTEAYENMQNYLNKINTLKNEIILGVKDSLVYKENTEFKTTFDALIDANAIHLVDSNDLDNDRAQAYSSKKANTGDEVGDIFLRIPRTFLESLAINKEELKILHRGSIIHETQHIIDFNQDKIGFTTLDTEVNAHALEYKYYKESGIDPRSIFPFVAKHKETLYKYKYEEGKTKAEAILALNELGYDDTALLKLINPDISAPVFTSSSTLSVKENQTDALIIQTSDANKVSYALSGGDSSEFNLNTTSGEVTFKVAPDYETKKSYTFTVTATDTLDQSRTQDIVITILDVEETITTTPTESGTITSPVTGKVWMDRNLGASRVCESYDDEQCYGDYYQWGREADGHEKSTSLETSSISSSLTPSHGDFITSSSSNDYDWTSTDSSGSTRSSNWNVCPSGFRLPTIDELSAESIDDRADAFDKLKLPSAGYRYRNSGSLNLQGSDGRLWSSSVYGSYSRYLYFYSSNANTSYSVRANGFAVRCLRD